MNMGVEGSNKNDALVQLLALDDEHLLPVIISLHVVLSSRSRRVPSRRVLCMLDVEPQGNDEWLKSEPN